MKTIKRKIIQIDENLCDGCGNCILACAEGAIEIIDGKAKVIADKYCDGLGACIGDCPQNALKIIEREADEFDEKAVEKLLKEKKEAEPLACGCPSSAMKTFVVDSADSCACADTPSLKSSDCKSFLGHWPVQIKLIPEGAPFLKDADLVIAADCVPVAYPRFHTDFLKGKAIMIGCPKFDDAIEYIEKLSRIFKISGIKSITSVVMEVPCCSAMPEIIKQALKKADTYIGLNEIVISAQGKII